MTWILVILAVMLVWPVLGRLLALLIAARSGREVGRAAMDATPDHIHLEPAAPDAWADRTAAERVAAILTGLGFEDAGAFSVREMPGVTAWLFAEPRDGWYAVVMEHPAVGLWWEFVSRNADGTGLTVTSLPATGLAKRPSFPVVNAPGTPVERLWERARRERPPAPRAPHTTDRVARDFETAYAEDIAWRKTRGVTRREVMAVAIRSRRAA